MHKFILMLALGLLTACEHYPRDLATGYAEGDLRGLWRVEFPSPDTK